MLMVTMPNLLLTLGVLMAAVNPRLTWCVNKNLVSHYFIYFMISLKQTWCLPIYSFFKPNISFQYYEGQLCHIFTCVQCTHRHCLLISGLKGQSISANLKHHALHCFGEDVDNAAIADKQVPKLCSSIFHSWHAKANNWCIKENCTHKTLSANHDILYIIFICLYSSLNCIWI